jgi:hypothetical protein
MHVDIDTSDLARRMAELRRSMGLAAEAKHIASSVKRVIRPVLRSAVPAIRREAPRRSGRLRRSVGVRIWSARKHEVHAKVGLNVGAKGERRAPHAPLVVLGSNERRGRGRMPANRVMARAIGTSVTRREAAMTRALERETSRLAKRALAGQVR